MWAWSSLCCVSICYQVEELVGPSLVAVAEQLIEGVKNGIEGNGR